MISLYIYKIKTIYDEKFLPEYIVQRNFKLSGLYTKKHTGIRSFDVKIFKLRDTSSEHCQLIHFDCHSLVASFEQSLI